MSKKKQPTKADLKVSITHLEKAFKALRKKHNVDKNHNSRLRRKVNLLRDELKETRKNHDLQLKINHRNHDEIERERNNLTRQAREIIKLEDEKNLLKIELEDVQERNMEIFEDRDEIKEGIVSLIKRIK